jgi:uncharacterized protein YdhG (YjbR/CyaY superfamily)
LTELVSQHENDSVSRQEIDRYLAGLDEPKRTTLRELRKTIAAVIPEAEQCISYGAPAFKVHGKVIAGFAAFKNHLSYLPHSGSVLAELASEVSTYPQTKSALHFPVDTPLRRELVEHLIAARMRQAFGARPDQG